MMAAAICSGFQSRKSMMAAPTVENSVDHSSENNDRALNIERLKTLSWMVRKCQAYQDEYNECKSIRGRWHQYYVDGSFTDCSDWLKDYNQCVKFRMNDDFDAVEETIRREVLRRKQRLEAAAGNDVWQPRTKPPGDWEAPLPEWKQRQQHGFTDAQR